MNNLTHFLVKLLIRFYDLYKYTEIVFLSFISLLCSLPKHAYKTYCTRKILDIKAKEINYYFFCPIVIVTI